MRGRCDVSRYMVWADLNLIPAPTEHAPAVGPSNQATTSTWSALRTTAAPCGAPSARLARSSGPLNGTRTAPTRTSSEASFGNGCASGVSRKLSMRNFLPTKVGCALSVVTVAFGRSPSTTTTLIVQGASDARSASEGFSAVNATLASACSGTTPSGCLPQQDI